MNRKIVSVSVGAFLLTLICFTTVASAEIKCGCIKIRNASRYERVTYNYYLPDTHRKLPVLVCVGGLNSNGQEFMRQGWFDFADKQGFAILSLGFTFNNSDWPKQRSYQYPQAWSGEALHSILNELRRTEKVNIKELYLFGISAGAQFVHRFALLYPDSCKAVAAHAAGGYTHPTRYIPTKFLITVGQLDNTRISRLDFAKLFVNACRNAGIDVTFQIIPGTAHRQTPQQDLMSLDFFVETKRSLK